MPTTDQFTPSSDADGVVIPAVVYVQLEAIRRSGVVNMAGWQEVQAIANQHDFFSTVVWLEDNKADYFRGFIKGFRPDRELTEDEQDILDEAPQ